MSSQHSSSRRLSPTQGVLVIDVQSYGLIIGLKIAISSDSAQQTLGF